MPASEAPATTPHWLRTSDGVHAAAVGIAACLLFLSTFSGQVALGDAPEFVSGVRTLGILHSPGYPMYVLAARAFATVVPVGGWAFRVNLFSVVCASLLVATVFLLARRLGASTAGAAIGAFALASSVSFWCNAAFAKHYALSGLLVAGAALLVVLWEQRGGTARLVLAAALLGASSGAAWQLGLIMALGLVALVAFGTRRPRVGELVVAGIAMLAVAISVWTFLIVRAHQDPTLNWGEGTTAGHLIDLVTQKDFNLRGEFGTGIPTADIPARVVNWIAIIARDFGLAAVALAVVGAFRRMPRAHVAFLAVVGVLNVVAVTFVAGIDRIHGFNSGLVGGGFVLDTLIIVALLVALGATQVVDAVVAWWGTRRVRSGARRIPPGRVRMAAVGIIAVLVVAPSVVVHHRYANHRIPPLADRYARRVFASLPQNSALLVWGLEYAAPMMYRQLVYGERRDVTVVMADAVGLAWYRTQLTRRLELGSTLSAAPLGTQVARLAATLRQRGPVFVDTMAMKQVGPHLAYRTRGLVGEVVDGTGPQVVEDAPAIEESLARADADDGLAGTKYLHFPNAFVYYFHERAYIELAKQYAVQDNLDAALVELEHALDVFPPDEATRGVLELGRRHDPNTKDLLLVL